MITDGERVIAESGAILEYLKATYDAEQRLTLTDEAARQQSRYWMHYAEGSLMPLLLMKLVFSRPGKPPVPWLLRPAGATPGKGIQRTWIDKQLVPHKQMIENHLAIHPWFTGQCFSIADIQMSFPLLALTLCGELDNMPATQQWLQKVQTRAAWQRALKQGGSLDLAQ